MFACWQTYVYFNIASNNVNKKMNKKALFLGTENAENAEIFLDRIDTVFLDTDTFDPFGFAQGRLCSGEVDTDSH